MVKLPSPPQVRNDEFYMVHYPCPCGIEECTQPVVINSHHARALQAAQAQREARRNAALAAANRAGRNRAEIQPSRRRRGGPDRQERGVPETDR